MGRGYRTWLGCINEEELAIRESRMYRLTPTRSQASDWHEARWVLCTGTLLYSEPMNPLFALCCFDFGQDLTSRWLSSTSFDSYNRHGYSLLMIAAAVGNMATVEILLGKGADVNLFTKSLDEKPLVAAIVNGHMETADRLIRAGALRSTSYSSMLVAVARIGDIEVVQWVLRQESNNINATPAQTLREKCPRGTELHVQPRKNTSLTITEAVLMAAMRNEIYAAEIITILLEHIHGNIEITEAIFAASSRKTKYKVNFYGPGRGMDYNMRRQYPDPRSSSNYYPNPIELLLKHPGASVNVTEGILLKALRISSERLGVIRLLPPMSVNSSTVTEAVLMEVVKDHYVDDNVETMTFLLRDPNTNIHITESLLIVAAREGNAGTMAFLLEQTRDKTDIIPPGLLLAVTSNERLGGHVLEVLLKHPIVATQVTQTVLLGTVVGFGLSSRLGHIVDGWDNYAEVLNLILNYPSAKLKITDVAINEAASNENVNSCPVAPPLLGNVNAKIQITEEIMLAAARSRYNSVEMLTIFLKHQSVYRNETEAAPNNTYITAAVVAAVAAHSEALEIIPLLLKQLPNVNHVITEDVLKSAACNQYCGRDVLLLLLKEPVANINITEAVLAAAAIYLDTESMVALLEQRSGDAEITEAVFAGAASNPFGVDMVSVLHNTAGLNMNINEAVLVAAAGSWKTEMMIALLEQSGDTEITEAVLVEAASNYYGAEIV